MIQSKEEFIHCAIEAHKPYDEHYDYTTTAITPTSNMIGIECQFHGYFRQNIHHHLNGKHCPKCAKILRSVTQPRKKKHRNYKKNPVTWEEFFQMAKERYGRFQYNNTEYKNLSTPITIQCTFHGTFNMTPGRHLADLMGCPKCTKMVRQWRAGYDTKSFIKRAEQVHGDLYDYSKVEYESNTTEVTIICKDHGDFQQKPYNHLKGYGCQKCGKTKTKKQCEWIEYMESQIGCKLVTDTTYLKMRSGKGYYPDAYDPATKTVYEFHGDFYHGNPTRYTPDTMNNVMYKTMGELYESTMAREEELEANGYTVLSIWESEWDAFLETLPIEKAA